MGALLLTPPTMGAMASTPASMSYATALVRNELFASPGLQRDVPKVLDPEEQVLLALPGVAGDFPDVLVVTARRLLVVKVTGGLKGAKVKREVPAPAVTGVSYRMGAFSRVKLAVQGRRDLKFMPHRKADAERFAGEFAHLLRMGELPA